MSVQSVVIRTTSGMRAVSVELLSRAMVELVHLRLGVLEPHQGCLKLNSPQAMNRRLKADGNAPDVEGMLCLGESARHDARITILAS